MAQPAIYCLPPTGPNDKFEAMPETLTFETHPDRYKHWKVSFDGPVARLDMDVQQDQAQRDGAYELKLNSYDIGVDIELSDFIQRVRFEHPEVRSVVVGSAIDRIFCSGANIYMLGSSTHGFKVNFCKFTNETRLYLEDLAAHSAIRTIAAVNGTASGGGYELALACDKILLVDDGNSAVSFPEAPLLAVLPGTGGLTRLVDKRNVRRDRADVFSTLVEGIRGKRAQEWGLVDEVIPRSKWDARVAEVSAAPGANTAQKSGPGLRLPPLGGTYEPTSIEHRYVKCGIDTKGRLANLTLLGPTGNEPNSGQPFLDNANESWMLRFFRELDDTLLHLRFNHPEIGLLVIRSKGDPNKVLAADKGLVAAQNHWLGREILHQAKRTLKRLDLMAKSMFTLVEPGSCFVGSMLEVLLASDRSYMLDDSDRPVHLALSELNRGSFPMPNGLTRIESRFYLDPEAKKKALAHEGPIDTETADALGLVTFTPDELDWDDEVRLAIEERAGFSPDALTGMEANLRFVGPETMETKIFGRLSAWQNWIFQRPNAVGPRGALTSYGKQTRPEFDFKRT